MQTTPPQLGGRVDFFLIYIAKINFYFVLVCYASFYFFCKYEANLKIVESKRERNTQLDTWRMLLPQAGCCHGHSYPSKSCVPRVASVAAVQKNLLWMDGITLDHLAKYSNKNTKTHGTYQNKGLAVSHLEIYCPWRFRQIS